MFFFRSFAAMNMLIRILKFVAIVALIVFLFALIFVVVSWFVLMVRTSSLFAFVNSFHSILC